MSAKVPSMQLLQIQRPLPPLDPAQRYTIPEALQYLRISRKTIYAMIARGELLTITLGGRQFTAQRKNGEVSRSRHIGRKIAARRFVPGSELVRLSQVPAASVAA